MAESPVSVVIPTYNYGRFIAEAIESVLTQSLPPREVIVVDDGSTDNTKEVTKSFGDRVRHIKQKNAGVCAARNRGVAESVGEYIAFLDADDIWEQTKIERQMEKFSGDREIGLVHCGVREFDSLTRETIAFQLEGLEGWVANELLLWERPVINVSGSSIMVSRLAFDEVGGFDVRQKVGEDWDFCYRVAKKFKVGFVREPLVNYRSHNEAAHRNVGEMEKGMTLFYEKAFADGDDTLRLRRRALGNFHRILSGSYLRAGDYARSASHLAKSLWYRPSGIRYLLAIPSRKLKANLTNNH